MTYEEYYQSARLELAQNNKSNLEKTAKKFLCNERTRMGNYPKDVRDLKEKIENYLDRHASLDQVFSVSSIMDILTNPREGDFVHELCYSIFIKDPSKQNLSELAQLKFLKSAKNLKASKLNSDGTGSLRFVDGEMVQDRKKKDLKGKKTKSIDFKVEHPNGVEELICAKDTRGQGGGQDNQCEDLRFFLREASKFLSRAPQDNLAYTYTALADGDYYNENVLNELRTIIPNNLKNQMRVVKSDEF